MKSIDIYDFIYGNNRKDDQDVKVCHVQDISNSIVLLKIIFHGNCINYINFNSLIGERIIATFTKLTLSMVWPILKSFRTSTNLYKITDMQWLP